MQKNKTHRIISISPSSSTKNPPIKLPQPHPQPHPQPLPQPVCPSMVQKSSTPIKHLIAHTRTNTNIINTNRSTAFREDSLIEDKNANLHNTGKDGNKNQDKEKQREGSQEKENLVGGFRIDQILHRIGKTYQLQKPNAASQLLKKTQISYLREHIRHAKSLISETDSTSSTNPLNMQNPCMQKIQKISQNLHEQISTYFSNLHKQLYKKQKQLNQELEQKIFTLKEKNITKSYQIATLKNYIEKCESDINVNYEEIINKIEIKQVNQIVDSYVKRLEFYMDKVKIKESVKIQLFDHKNNKMEENIEKILKIVDEEIKIVCFDQNKEEREVENEGLEGRMSIHINNIQVNSNRQSAQKHKPQPPVPRLTLQKSQKLQELLHQTQNISLSKILGKKSKLLKNEDQPRIASARGKY